MYKASNIHYDLSDRMRGLDTGGIGAMHRLALCANVRETPTPLEFSVEGGEERTNGLRV
jgi:hypothetical protein